MKILSFGEIIWDVYDDKKLLGGAPFNFAAHAVKQGATAAIISAVGEDSLGKKTLSYVKKYNVETDYITINKYPTGQCLVTLDGNKVPHYSILENVSYDFINTPNLSTEFDVISFGTLALRKEHNICVLKSILEKYKFKAIFSDLNIRPPFFNNKSVDFCLANNNIVKISDEELPTIIKLLFGIENCNIKDSVSLLSNKYKNIELFIITKGSEGSIAFDIKNNSIYECPAKKVDVVSTVGAGDSFGAAFLVEYFKTNNISESLIKATDVSAYVVSHLDAIPD